MDSGEQRSNNTTPATPPVEVTMEARPERRLIRPGGSHRHVDFAISVGEPAPQIEDGRTPLRLALVLDRSGSMQGEKIATAKRAALAVVDRLDSRDEIAVVAFDDRVDVLQPAAPCNAETRAAVRKALAFVEARAQTALHEGWLTGCRAIAPNEALPRDGVLARCFLLTDGLANVGEIDPERIASDAAGIRENAGIGTSTFGIGPDYNEALLGPMAVAGGGQFHHLSSAEEIIDTFVGELGELRSVAAGNVVLELDGDRDVTVDVVSQYRASQSTPGTSRVSVIVGDLPGGEDRHVVVRFGFPGRRDLAEHVLRARLVWLSRGAELSTPWQEVRFTYANNHACDAEEMDASVMHWVGLAHAHAAKQEATQLSRRGDMEGVKRRLIGVAKRISEYARHDRDLVDAVRDLEGLAHELSERPIDPMAAKEQYFQAMRASRGQKDLRGKL